MKKLIKSSLLVITIVNSFSGLIAMEAPDDATENNAFMPLPAIDSTLPNISNVLNARDLLTIRENKGINFERDKDNVFRALFAVDTRVKEQIQRWVTETNGFNEQYNTNFRVKLDSNNSEFIITAYSIPIKKNGLKSEEERLKNVSSEFKKEKLIVKIPKFQHPDSSASSTNYEKVMTSINQFIFDFTKAEIEAQMSTKVIKDYRENVSQPIPVIIARNAKYAFEQKLTERLTSFIFKCIPILRTIDKFSFTPLIAQKKELVIKIQNQTDSQKKEDKELLNQLHISTQQLKKSNPDNQDAIKKYLEAAEAYLKL